MDNKDFLLEYWNLIKYLAQDVVVRIPKEVTEELHSDAFVDCPLIETIYIPETTKYVRLFASEDTLRNLKEIIVDENNPYYSSIDGVLYNKDQTVLLICPAGKCGDFVIPCTVKMVESGAFQYCDKLKSIHIPASVEKISFDDYDFYSFNGVFVVDPNNPYYDFDDNILYTKGSGYSENKKAMVVYCSPNKEGEVVLPETTFMTGYGAFRDCNKITSVIFKTDNNLYLSEHTFGNCKSLKTLELPSDIINFVEYLPKTVAITLRVDSFSLIQEPEEVKRVLPLTKKVIFNFPKFLAISDDLYMLIIEENQRSIELYCKEGSEYIRFEIEEDENGPVVGHYFIGDDCPIFYADINEYICYDGPTDADLIIPEHVIETVAFYDTDFPYDEYLFNSVSIPKSLIDYYFGLQTKKYIVHKDNPNYTTINGDLYSKDGKRLVACAYKEKDECLKIPDGVTAIDGMALMYVHGGIIIPKTVTQIEWFADECSFIIMHVNKELALDYDGFDANAINFKEIYFEMNEEEAKESEFFNAYIETIEADNHKETKLFCIKDGQYVPLDC